MQDTRKRLLELAVTRMGRAKAAACLDVPPDELDDWLRERMPMPQGRLIALIDLLDRTSD